MGAIQEPPPGKLVASVLYRDEPCRRAGLSRLEEAFGPIDTLSAALPFDQTCYYEAEMGGALSRVIVSFHRLIPAQALSDAKVATGRIESALADREGRRSVNLDPGLLTEHALFLATTKPNGHRPHLGSGIYADLTLIHGRGGFEPLPWTYPDYCGATLRDIFQRLRARLIFDWTGRIPRSAANGERTKA